LLMRKRGRKESLVKEEEEEGRGEFGVRALQRRSVKRRKTYFTSHSSEYTHFFGGLDLGPSGVC
jgi:hypothetical protein